MGDSVTVYMNPLKVSKEMIDRISDSLQAQFEYGRFNSMEDIYEYKNDSGFIKDSKSGIEFSTKYLHVQRSPKFDTAEYHAYKQATVTAEATTL